MASSSNDGRSLNITLVAISGEVIIEGTWHGHCKAHELFQAAYKSKPGFMCKLLNGSEELSPQSDLASLCQNCGHFTVVWMNGAVENKQAAFHLVFAAVKSDGSLITWGSAAHGGDSSLVEHQLQEGVVQVVGNSYAFAAIKCDGSVITWGWSHYGGDSTRVEHRLQEGVVQVVGNNRAFAAVKSDGSVITWGDADCGGDSSRLEHRLQEGVVQVVGNDSAFVAIKCDGCVITWGDA
ncbi:unnamed protein product, partial [Polarella glacialis]